MKKLLIVADMEGIAGIPMSQFWPTVPGNPLYYSKRKLLVKEITAAIQGAINAGLKTEEIVVLDWHWDHDNLKQTDFPAGITLIQKNEGPLLRTGAIKNIFLIGFHAQAGLPVRYAHTMRSIIKTFLINNTPAGEATFWAFAAGSVNIPIALITGDSFAIKEIQSLGLATECVETKNQTSNPDPEEIYKKIEIAAEEAIHKQVRPLEAPSPFSIKFSFKYMRPNKHIPSQYFTRREKDYLILERETALEVYEDFRGKIYPFIRTLNPLRLLQAAFLK